MNGSLLSPSIIKHSLGDMIKGGAGNPDEFPQSVQQLLKDLSAVD